MRSIRKFAPFLVLICIIIVGSSGVSAQTAQATFVRVPANYDPQTGAFTLEETAYGGLYGKLCLAYDYFVFTTNGGQAVSWQVNSPGQVIYYVIIDAGQLGIFDANAQNCNLNIPAPLQFFNSQTTLTWTPPGSGQFALIFLTRVFYSGPVYLMQ